MKLLLTALFVVVLLFTKANGQEVITFPAGTGLESAVMVSQNSACLVGDNEILHLDLTTHVSTRVFFRTNAIVQDVSFSPATLRGYAVGWDWTNTIPIILKTVNGGLNWQEVIIPDYNYVPFSVHVSNDTVVIAGSSGSLARTVNDGNSWQITTSFNCWFYANEDILLKDQYIFVTAAKLYRSTDGINWLNVGLDTNFTHGTDFSGLTTVGDKLFGAGGELGVPYPAIAYTTNHGTSWQQSTMPDTGWLSAIKFADALHGFAAGYRVSAQVYPVAYETTNGGASWFKMPLNLGTGQGFMDIFINDQNVYLVGPDYIVVQPLVITEIEGENYIPRTYQLSQNYPNPFNPSTRINFSVSQTGPVSLKIFDITGKEVTSLVNEIKPAGEYTVEFSAEHLSSGIYFYRLETSQFAETKKMNLIK